ncbi:endonuclease/exonuclease/phosphatase family protein [Phytoactinopolyspora mesophila]|uniref:Endonuclease n=1 Tax=Phytoactinopolyspora mesophila TaxID=2650750 RepID=A0A7K3M7U8_9ACTN|nr:endonuclease/exonuclease/phosphatase family protein [Phytoactinopolyspora mesophila]NDL59127.1 endonuclease [Phytoactinopolyspora mesophila]
MRFGTYNLLNGLIITSGTVREGTLAAAVSSLEADVLALQEVDYDQRRSGETNQAAIAAEAAGADWWRFAPALTGDPAGRWEPADPLVQPDGPAYGVALLSRLPVLTWSARWFPASPVRVPLQVPGRRGLVPVKDHPRVALAAIAIGPAGPFTVAAAHLSFVPGWNIRQLRTITRWLSAMPAPQILLGDFNLPGRVPHLVTGWNQLARVGTYPAWRPRVQWDHVITHGAGHESVRAVTAHRLPVSDHAALTVDIEL